MCIQTSTVLRRWIKPKSLMDVALRRRHNFCFRYVIFLMWPLIYKYKVELSWAVLQATLFHWTADDSVFRGIVYAIIYLN